VLKKKKEKKKECTGYQRARALVARNPRTARVPSVNVRLLRYGGKVDRLFV